jgi:hypothetical protein
VRKSKTTYSGVFLLIKCLLLIARLGLAETSLTGVTGLVNVPTARVIPDGKLAFGLGYIDNEYSLRGPDYPQFDYYVTVGFLPFLEGSLRITHFPGNSQPENYGSEKDRMASVRLLLTGESQYSPSVLLGFHDILGVYHKTSSSDSLKNVNFNTTYIAISKSISLPFIGSTSVHAGYASDLLMPNALSHSMLGFFAGADKKIGGSLTFMAEYDSKKYNMGLRLTPAKDRINLDIAFLGFKRISGGMAVSLDL